MALGATAYVTKPFKAPELQDIVRKVLKFMSSAKEEFIAEASDL